MLDRAAHIAAIAAVVLTGLMTTGCEDPFIDPFQTGSYFTVWGYISTFQDTHYVRVIPVRRFPEEINRPNDPHGEIDAEVFSEDVSTGRVVKWRHSLERLSDGTYGHVFMGSFTIREGATYRLSVVRSDGATSIAETTVPVGFDAEVLPAVVEGSLVTQTIRWKETPTPEQMTIQYCAGPLDSRACSDGEDGHGLLVSYGNEGRRVGNDWEVDVQLSRDFDFLRTVAGLPVDQQLGLFSLQMRLNALDSGWRVLQDTTAFAQPDALHNVENGFGYWGAIGNSILDWFPDDEALAPLNITAQPYEG